MDPTSGCFTTNDNVRLHALEAGAGETMVTSRHFMLMEYPRELNGLVCEFMAET